MATTDTPPLDSTVLAAIESADEGISVRGLITELLSQDFPRDHIIRAIHRVLDRGLAELGDSAKIVATKERLSVAA
jgi:hypothetical protein